MAKNPHFADTWANSVTASLANSGKLRIYDGSQPANANTAVTTQTLLVELTMNATAFGAPSGGVYTANAITSGTAVASSTATWFRLFKSDGTTVLMDGSVGTASADLILATTSIVSGATVSCSSFTYTFTE